MSDEARYGQDPAISAGFHHDEPSPSHEPSDPLEVNLHNLPIPGLDDDRPQRPTSFAADGPIEPAAEAQPPRYEAAEATGYETSANPPSAPASPTNIPRLEDVLLPEGSEHRSRKDRRKAELEAQAAAEYAARQSGRGQVSAGTPALEPDPAAPPAIPGEGYGDAQAPYTPEAFQAAPTPAVEQPYVPPAYPEDATPSAGQPHYPDAAPSGEAPTATPDPYGYAAPTATPDYGTPESSPDYGTPSAGLPSPEYGAPVADMPAPDAAAPADLPPPAFDPAAPSGADAPFATDSPVPPAGSGEFDPGYAPPSPDSAFGEPSPFSIEQPQVPPVAEPMGDAPAPPGLGGEDPQFSPGFGNDYDQPSGQPGTFEPEPGFGAGASAVPELEEDPEPPPPPADAGYSDMPPPQGYEGMPPPPADAAPWGAPDASQWGAPAPDAGQSGAPAPDANGDGSQWGAPPQESDGWISSGWAAAGAQAVGSIGADPDFGYSPQAYEMAPPPPVPDEDEIEAEVTTAAFSELSSLAVERPKVQRTRAGLTKREVSATPTAELGDGSIKPAERDADAVRSRYSSFYSGTTRAKADAVQSGQKVPGHAGGEA